jgi:hypothetical protein
MKPGWAIAGVLLGLVCLVEVAHAQPTTDQLLTDLGLSADDKQNVLSGQFVNVSVSGVSDRDLSFAIAFLVKTPPDALAKQIVTGELATADPQVRSFGEPSGSGSLADFAKLTITDDEAQALTNAKSGEALNLSTSEIAAFRALAGSPTGSVQEQLRRMLLARYQAYRASGLSGIAPYDRGDGKTSQFAADLRKASQATPVLTKYLPGFQKLLLGYPQATVAGMQERFFWFKSLIHDKTTYVLAHIFVAPEGAARVAVRREYYVSTGYNGEETVAGFLPVQEGTVVVSIVHAFTDQVTGFGGSFKRDIGSKVMAGKMKDIYEAERVKSQNLR